MHWYKERVDFLKKNYNLSEREVLLQFYSCDTMFVENLKRHPTIFEIHWIDCEYLVCCQTENEEVLKEICDDFASYTNKE